MYVCMYRLLTQVKGKYKRTYIRLFWRSLKNERDFDISGLEKGTKFLNKGKNKKYKYDYIYKLITFPNLLYICE